VQQTYALSKLVNWVVFVFAFGFISLANGTGGYNSKACIRVFSIFYNAVGG
jgi:hypothetical protein